MLASSVSMANSSALAQATQAPIAVPDELLFGIRPGAATEQAVSASLADVGKMLGSQSKLGAYRIRVAPGLTLSAAAARLKARPGIAYVEPNYIRRATSSPNDPSYSSQWAPQIVGADKAWDIWNPQAKIVVAIVDTGVDYNHPDLSGVLYRTATGAVIGYDAATGSFNAQDDQGHGTHVAGITAAHINNGVGVAGIAGWSTVKSASDSYVRIMPIKVLDASGSGTDSDVADGIVWAADNGAGVINLSLGSAGYSYTLDSAVQYAWSKGAVVVAAAGNESTSLPSYPAAYQNVLSVAATDQTDRLASFSNYGSWVDVAAPGVSIYSTELGGAYVSYSGTSMATPLVAGEAAAIRAQFPSLSNADVVSRIKSNVDAYLPYSSRTLSSTAGRVNVFRALGGSSTASHPTKVTFALNPIWAGKTVTATVTLDTVAPAGGQPVTLSTGTALASVPAGITIPAGQTAGTFTVTTAGVAARTTIAVTAQAGGKSVAANLVLVPAVPAGITYNPTQVRGGLAVTATLRLNGAAPAGGLTVSVASQNTAVLTPDSPTVTVLEGQSEVTFSVTTYPVTVKTLGVIKATANGTSILIGLNVFPPAPRWIKFDVNPVYGGRAVTATLTLASPAPAGGWTLTLKSQNTALATVPASVTVPAGQMTVDFPVQTYSVSAATMAVIEAVSGTDGIKYGLRIFPAVP
jgi:thermitase